MFSHHSKTVERSLLDPPGGAYEQKILEPVKLPLNKSYRKPVLHIA